VPNLPGALEVFRTESLTQVVVPGSAEIRFPKAGAYAVYYEYRTNTAGVSYARDPRLPDMTCWLISDQTGEAVPLKPGTVKGDVYAHPDRAGVMFKRFRLDQPGAYQFSCGYPYGGSTPKRVLAVGPNLVQEFLNVAAKPIAALLAGALAFAAACGVSILVVGIVAFKRHRSRKALASHA
jgi:hypothetical protein